MFLRFKNLLKGSDYFMMDKYNHFSGISNVKTKRLSKLFSSQ
jgi:hypothetical protein